jgi:hypothetical protein
VARTVPKESAADETVYFWREYRIRPLTTDEFDTLREGGTISRSAVYRPFAIESRRVDGTATRDPRNPWPWGVWGTGDTPGELIDEFLGDTAFSQAESLVPEHAALVAWTVAIRAALTAASDAALSHQEAVRERDEFVRTETEKYEQKVRGKSPDAVKRMRGLTAKRLAGRLSDLKSAIAVASEVLEAARAKVKEVRKTKPSFGLKPDPDRTDRLGV